MREFHKEMFKHNARLEYTDSKIEVFLNKPCPLKAIKEISDAFYIEFGITSDRIQLEGSDNYIILIASISDPQAQDTSIEVRETAEEEQEQDEGKNEDYNSRVLTTALEVLSEQEGLTPTEIQRELAKRGVVATHMLIGKLLSGSGRARKVGDKWYLNGVTTPQCSSGSEALNGWTQLTDSVFYKKDGEDIKFGLRKNGRFETLKRIPYRTLEDLYKILPDEANSVDIREMAVAVGIDKTSNLEPYIMRVLANEFGGELQQVGRSFVLVKGGDA